MKKSKNNLILSNFYMTFDAQSSRNKGVIVSLKNCAGVFHKNSLEAMKTDGITVGAPSILWLISDRIILVRLFADGDLKKKRHEKFDQDLKKKSSLQVEIFDVAEQMIEVFIKKILLQCKK